MGLVWHHAMLFEFCLSVMKMKRYDNTRRELRSTGRCSTKDVCTNSMLRRIFLNRNLIIINKRVVKKNTNEYDISWLGSRPCAFFGGIIFEYEWRHGSFLYFKIPISDHKFQMWDNGIWNYQSRIYLLEKLASVVYFKKKNHSTINVLICTTFELSSCTTESSHNSERRTTVQRTMIESTFVHDFRRPQKLPCDRSSFLELKCQKMRNFLPSSHRSVTRL